MTESVNVTKPKKIPSELKLQPESSKNPIKDTTLNFESDKNGTISSKYLEKVVLRRAKVGNLVQLSFK